MEPISSRSNPKIKQARLLRQHKERQASGLFLVEGIRPVGEAFEAGVAIEAVFYSPEELSSAFALDLVAKLQRSGAPCYPTSPEVFASLAEKENPQGLLAVVHARQSSLAQLHPGNFPWGVALVSPQDPGNIGAILRTIDAVGASGLILLDGGADPSHPGVVRASMGAIFWHPVVSASFRDFERWALEHQYAVFGTSAHGNMDFQAVPQVHTPLILLLGSEQKGLSEAQQVVCTHLIRLPMRGRVTSLNLAVAAGIMLYSIHSRLGEK